jgi:hypothetical protein
MVRPEKCVVFHRRYLTIPNITTQSQICRSPMLEVAVLGRRPEAIRQRKFLCAVNRATTQLRAFFFTVALAFTPASLLISHKIMQ